MKIQNRPIWSTAIVALILFSLPCFGSRVVLGSTGNPGHAWSALEGVTHIVEFVKGEPPRSPQFNPRELVICVGDSIEFKDNWTGQVNAFSYSSALRFDTGRFRAGESRTVGPFPQEGGVRFYDELSQYIKGYIVVVDCSSKGREAGIKRGAELLREWLERAEGKQDKSGQKNPPQDNSSSPVHSDFGSGLHTTTFDTLYGQVIVYLPDDTAAGDTISGTVETEANGKTEEEKARNQSKLDECSVVLDVTRVTTKERSLLWHVPDEGTKSAVSYPMRIFEAGTGKELATTDITPEPRIMGGEFVEPPDRRTIPPFLWQPVWQQAGRSRSVGRSMATAHPPFLTGPRPEARSRISRRTLRTSPAVSDCSPNRRARLWSWPRRM